MQFLTSLLFWNFVKLVSILNVKGEITWEPKSCFIDDNGIENDIFKAYNTSHPIRKQQPKNQPKATSQSQPITKKRKSQSSTTTTSSQPEESVQKRRKIRH